MNDRILILGAGMSGLGAAIASGFPAYEANIVPGGICATYYLRPGRRDRLYSAPEDEEAYRFEVGGGHWMWGGDSFVVRLVQSLTTLKRYARRAAVFLPEKHLIVPYPLQYHLRYLGAELAKQSLQEMIENSRSVTPATTLAGWLRTNFGPTLCELFFDPFHELYTAGLWRIIAPQDSSKSPVDLTLAIRGAFGEGTVSGYNITFTYPEGGLNVLAQRMASMCNVHYQKRVVFVDVKRKELSFADGSTTPYDRLISTIPLNHMIDLTGLSVDAQPDPFTSVLVLNVAATKGQDCPSEHWVYVPKSEAGFHRVGFYSNVDTSFLPRSVRLNPEKVGIYVEKAYLCGQKPSDDEIAKLSKSVIADLKNWGWITDVEMIDPTWVEVAYVWSAQNSVWRQKSLHALEAHDIYQVGRYGQWVFDLGRQGILESIREGITAGTAVKAAMRWKS